MVEANLRCNESFGIDLLSTMSDAYREAYDFGAKIIFPEDGLPICTELLVPRPADLGKLHLFDPGQSVRMLDRIQAIACYASEAGDRYPILGWVEGPIAETADLCGLTDVLIYLYDEPSFIEDIFNLCTEQAIRCALAQINAGANIVGIGDAAASLLGLEMYTEFVLPAEQRLIAAIHAAGAKVKLHICGDITHLLEAVGRSGADIIDLDWMVSIPSALAAWPHGPLANGNFDPVAIMLQGRPEDVRLAARENIQQGGNRICVSPGCEVPLGTPVENLLALRDTLCE